MRNQLFNHGFLVKFSSVKGSTGTPSDRSNVSKCELEKLKCERQSGNCLVFLVVQ